ncbi:hypothetical protein [uncultured Clostridium sp.]
MHRWLSFLINPDNILESILNLPLEKIEKINGDIFDIESLEELKKYL